MPHTESGNYYEESFFTKLSIGITILTVIAVILSIPGWISAAIWGWDKFFEGAGAFWAIVVIVGFLLFCMWAVITDDD